MSRRVARTGPDSSCADAPACPGGRTAHDAPGREDHHSPGHRLQSVARSHHELPRLPDHHHLRHRRPSRPYLARDPPITPHPTGVEPDPPTGHGPRRRTTSLAPPTSRPSAPGRPSGTRHASADPPRRGHGAVQRVGHPRHGGRPESAASSAWGGGHRTHTGRPATLRRATRPTRNVPTPAVPIRRP